MENRMSAEFVNGSDATPTDERAAQSYRALRAEVMCASTLKMAEKTRLVTGDPDACVGIVFAAESIAQETALEDLMGHFGEVVEILEGQENEDDWVRLGEVVREISEGLSGKIERAGRQENG